MAVIEINRNPSPSQLRQFAILWLVFVAGLGLGAWFRLDNRTAAVILWALAMIVPIAGRLFPPFVRAVFVGLSLAAFPIGFVLSHVILAVVYYLVLTPVGLAMRLLRYDPMHRAFEPDRESYWVSRDPHPDPKQYFKQY
jgi:hypothetical protein